MSYMAKDKDHVCRCHILIFFPLSNGALLKTKKVLGSKGKKKGKKNNGRIEEN